LTLGFFLDIFERFARTPPEVCVNMGGVREFSEQVGTGGEISRAR
jgi:hypothetical protein